MNSRVLCAVMVVLVTLVVFGVPAKAQSDATLDYEINAIRSDIKANKADIVQQALDLNAEQSKAFWPVYKQYDQELSTINDQLVNLIKDYADKFGTINDADATALTQKAFDYQEKKIQLKKKYFPIFAKATTPLTAAQFFQVEYRLELLFNLKLASELPALLYQPAAASASTKK